MQSSQASCYFHPLRSKYSPQKGVSSYHTNFGEILIFPPEHLLRVSTVYVVCRVGKPPAFNMQMQQLGEKFPQHFRKFLV